MTLTDTSILVALIDAGDPHHERCTATLVKLPRGGLLTTWPCLTEAAYLLYKRTGWSGVDALWRYVELGVLHLHHANEEELLRIRELMTTYRNLPCDLADASLVATAEAQNLHRIFTLDSHFYAYRLVDGSALEVLP